jgi:trk system potassium uptake protein
MDKQKTISGYQLILNYMGIFSILIGIINMIPLLILIFVPAEIKNALYFLIPSIFSIVIGVVILSFFRQTNKGRLERHQDAVLVVFIWIYAIFISSMPFVLSGNYSFTQSVFEATSGFSTTGLTVVQVEEAPMMFLLFRSLLQFFGGVGLVLVLTSAISDKFGMRLYNAEGHSDKLMPNLLKSARMIMTIYVGYIIFGMVSYRILGMTWFDAINHSICAVATGGFSTKAQSIGHYDHAGIETVTIVLMLLGGTNFFVHLMLLRGKIKNVIKHVEIKLLGALTLLFVPIFIIVYQHDTNQSFFASLRVSLFQFMSAITGTGYQTVSGFDILPMSFIFGIIILMVLGAGMGSTAGGMKQYRVALAIKSQYWQIKDQMAHKKTIRTHFINKLGIRTVVEKEDIMQNYAFLTTYVAVLLIGTFIFTLYGHSLTNSMFEFASALGTVGLSVGITGAGAPPMIHWTATLGMFLGRLEFYVIFIAIARFANDASKHKQHA